MRGRRRAPILWLRPKEGRFARWNLQQEAHPVIGAPRVTQLWAEARRQIILGTALAPGDSSNVGEYVVLAPRASLAQSQLHIVKLSLIGVEFQFSEPGGQLERTTSPESPDAGFTAEELKDGQIVLRWAGGGMLQRAEQVDGPATESSSSDIRPACGRFGFFSRSPAPSERCRPSESTTNG